jgi:hypothetical protein
MAEIFICKRGDLTPDSVKALREAAVVVVESKNPDGCTFIRSTERVSNSDMLWAAVKALNVTGTGAYSTGGDQRADFMRTLLNLIEASRDEVAVRLMAPMLRKHVKPQAKADTSSVSPNDK